MNMLDDAEVDRILAAHFRENFGPDKLVELNGEFRARSVAPLRGFCPPSLLDVMRREAAGLLENHGVFRNVQFKETDNTPRRMTCVGQPTIRKHGQIIPATYASRTLIEVLSAVIGEPVNPVPYAGEEYTLTSLGQSGDTHGWHWDDYGIGFVWILDAPHPRDGGFIQCVPNTRWNKQQPDVYAAFLQSPIYSYAFAPGDAYVLRTDTTLHRVYPVSGNGRRRVIVNMTWATDADLARPMTHETNDALFGATA
jgi:hypothetical protein